MRKGRVRGSYVVVLLCTDRHYMTQVTVTQCLMRDISGSDPVLVDLGPASVTLQHMHASPGA